MTYTAAMEPGERHREHDRGVLELDPVSVVPQWSPVNVTGNTTQQCNEPKPETQAAMEPGERHREHPGRSARGFAPTDGRNGAR